MTLNSIANRINMRFDTITSAYLYASEAAVKRREQNFHAATELSKMYKLALDKATKHYSYGHARALAEIEFNNKLIERSVRQSSEKRANRPFMASRRRRNYTEEPIYNDSFLKIHNIPVHREQIRPLGPDETVETAFSELFHTLWINSIMWNFKTPLHFPSVINFSPSWS